MMQGYDIVLVDTTVVRGEGKGSPRRSLLRGLRETDELENIQYILVTTSTVTYILLVYIALRTSLHMPWRSMLRRLRESTNSKTHILVIQHYPIAYIVARLSRLVGSAI